MKRARVSLAILTAGLLCLLHIPFPVSADSGAAQESELDKDGVRAPKDSGVDPDGCATGGPVYLTNVTCALLTNQSWTVTFDVAGGTNGAPYDILCATNLVGDDGTNATWTWLGQAYTCSRCMFTYQPATMAFYQLGVAQDSDGDGLTDAYEIYVSKTDPYNPDTDGDGLSDGYELNTSRTDPLTPQPIPTLSGCPISKCPVP